MSFIDLDYFKNLNPSIFEQIFGFQDDKFITYIFLIFKYYIYKNCVNSRVLYPHFKDLKCTKFTCTCKSL